MLRAKATRLTALMYTLVLAAFNTAPAAETNDQISVQVEGDIIISLPWSDDSGRFFNQLIAEIRSADAAVLNLETLIHTYQGNPQAESGGTWKASDPRIAGELAWAGFDIAGLANNHTFDYGATGIIENIEYLRNAGIVNAGAGMDLQQARQPAYFEIAGAKVTLLSTAASFVSFGRAGRSRPDLHGRPGLNPLTVRKKL